MKKYFYNFMVLVSISLLTRSFRCNQKYPIECNNYTNDTAYLPIQVSNIALNYRVLDTVKIESLVYDSLQTATGLTLLSRINPVTNKIQAYKVVRNGPSTTLNYANIEFNYIITEGYFNNIYGAGFNVIYNRVQGQNIFKGALVCGFPGLYLIKFNEGSYGYSSVLKPNDQCYTASPSFLLPSENQNVQYWDNLGTTSLILANSNGTIIANKTDTDYFFLNVLP